jgi:hypothetical protein
LAAENTMITDNIFSGLKVVDLASFVAGPGAAVILSDFGADVIKVEPPKGDLWRMANKVPPQPLSKDAYQWHVNNRNKRGLVLDLKSPDAGKILERLVKWADVLIVNTPHAARKKLKLEYDDIAQWNSRLIYADLTGYGEKGPDADLPGFDVTAYWSRSGLLSLTRDAGSPPTLPFAGTGDSPTAVGLFAAIVTGLYRRERTGKGSYVTTSLLANKAIINRYFEAYNTKNDAIFDEIIAPDYIDHGQSAYMGSPGRGVAGAKNDLRNSLDKLDDFSYVIEAMIASDSLPDLVGSYWKGSLTPKAGSSDSPHINKIINCIVRIVIILLTSGISLISLTILLYSCLDIASPISNPLFSLAKKNAKAIKIVPIKSELIES